MRKGLGSLSVATNFFTEETTLMQITWASVGLFVDGSLGIFE